MVVTVIGLFILYAGFGCIIYGTYLLNNIGEQLHSILRNAINQADGVTGYYFVFGGILLVLLGSIVVVIRAYRYSKRRYY